MSMITDHYRDKWTGPYINPIYPQPVYPIPDTNPLNPQVIPNLLPSAVGQPQPKFTITSPVTREEFDQLKKDVQEMKELLIRAKKYDEDNGQPDCQMDEKVELVKKIAAIVGVNLEEVFSGIGKPIV